MNTQDVVALITVPGSIIGFITGGFIVWERLFRYQPASFIVARPLVPGGATKACYLQVVNRSERPILMSWPSGLQPNAMRLSVDHSSREIIRSLLDGERAVVVDGKGTATYPVLTPSNWSELDLDQVIEMKIKWRFAQPLIWKHDRSFTVRISKRSYLLLIDELESDENGGL